RLVRDRPDDGDRGTQMNLGNQVIHVVVVERHAALRPVLAATPLPVDLDETADLLVARHLADALQPAEPRPVLGVRIVNHQGTVVVGLPGAAYLGDAIAALGRGVVTGVRLGGHARHSEVD